MSTRRNAANPFPGFEPVDLFAYDADLEAGQPMLVNDLIPAGVPGLLVAEPSLSKTQFMLTVSVGLVTGTSVFGLDTPEARPVIYFALEGGRNDLRVRVRRIAQDLGLEGMVPEKQIQDDLKVLIPVVADPFSEQNSLDRAFQCASTAMEAYGRPGLLVVDTLAHLISGEENAAESARPIWSWANALANQWGWTVVLVHHRRKPNPKQGVGSRRNDLSDIRGTSAHGAAARFVLGITQLNQRPNSGWSLIPDNLLELRMLKRNDGPEGFTLKLRRDPETGLLREYIDQRDTGDAPEGESGSHPRVSAGTKQGKVLKIFLDTSLSEEDQVRHALKWFSGSRDPEASLRSALRRLRDKKLLPCT